jgi:hypothetical protein
MKIVITESQNSHLVSKLTDLINRFDFGKAVTAVGSVKNLVKLIGKDTLYNILLDLGLSEIKETELITSRYDIPTAFYQNSEYLTNYALKLLNKHGPMYLFRINGERFLYQNHGPIKLFISEYYGRIPNYDDIVNFKQNDLAELIELYYQEEE